MVIRAISIITILTVGLLFLNNNIQDLERKNIAIEKYNLAVKEINDGFSEVCNFEKLIPYKTLRAIEKDYIKAEEKLSDISKIQFALGDGKNLHYLSEKLVEEYTKMLSMMLTTVDRLDENNDNDYNFSLNYLKGCIAYRTIFFGEGDAKELFNQSLAGFKKALIFKPGDLNTVANIELLIDARKKMKEDGSRPKPGMLFPSNTANNTQLKGN